MSDPDKTTDFQRRIIECVKKEPNQMTSTWSIAQHAFPEKWARRKGRGALIGHIVRAASSHPNLGVLPPQDQYGDYTIYFWEAKPKCPVDCERIKI